MSEQPKAKEPVQSRLVGAHFHASIPFGNESMAVHVAANGSGTADFVAPARISADGQPVPISGNERSDGLIVRKRVQDRLRNQWFVAQSFVPWSNVKALVYAE